MEEITSKRNWFRIFSPGILGIILSIIGLIESVIDLESSGGWSFLGVIALLPALGILAVFDVIVKLIFKKETLIIWIAELLVLGLIYALWISKFGG